MIKSQLLFSESGGTMLNDKDINYIAQKCDVRFDQAQNVAAMLLEGMTVPFISRYRKERTGNLDEEKVNLVNENFEYVNELNERKETVLKTIDQQGKLDDELRKKIEETYSKTELEDIYLPYKPKRRTKATAAREKGLEPLALAILDEHFQGSVEELAATFIAEEKGVNSAAEAIEGAGHIIAEKFSENTELRKKVRNDMFEKGILYVSVTPDFENSRTKYEQYYDYKEPVKSMPSHRILAIRRGETEKVLKSKIEIDSELLQDKIKSLVISASHPNESYLEQFLEDAMKRLVLPSIELDIQAELKKQADLEAIGVFASNLEQLLLAPPAGGMRVLAADPGYRTGCKIVALGETGKLLDNTTIYPTKPLEKTVEAEKIIKDIMEKHGIEAVIIGNGTASRETLAFFKKIVPSDVIVMVVSEAGASVYSASEAGREEFPTHDVTVRGAVSIGRRFQDPLAELVKIDPKSIGVGQYQHDVNQGLLKQKLDTVVSLVVNRVGVELSTASYHLLKYVSGIGETLAKNIVQYRDEHEIFRKREDLLAVRMFGPKAFQQSAGFLRLRNGDNLLDSTGIHPESYFIVENMCLKMGKETGELVRNKELIAAIKPEDYVTADFGLPTIRDILKELETPARDPRKDFEVFAFEEGVETIADLAEGMVLKGVATNVTRFGAFVDIGVHQDGLVHISELSNRFITHPEEVISVGDKVRVKVIKIDPELKRIQLSIKALQEPPKRNHQPQRKRPRQEQVKKEDPLESLKRKWGAR